MADGARKLPRMGKMALQAGYRLPLQVLRSNAGFYIGTADEEGPCSRESLEYFPTEHQAAQALASSGWTQREHESFSSSHHPSEPSCGPSPG